MSSIVRFSEMREPFEITSKRDLESVNSCTGIRRPHTSLNSTARVEATSNRSLNAITSPAIAERTTLFDLYDLN